MNNIVWITYNTEITLNIRELFWREYFCVGREVNPSNRDVTQRKQPEKRHYTFTYISEVQYIARYLQGMLLVSSIHQMFTSRDMRHDKLIMHLQFFWRHTLCHLTLDYSPLSFYLSLVYATACMWVCVFIKTNDFQGA